MLQKRAQQIISSRVSRSERTRQLQDYQEALVWAYARLNQIHTRFMQFVSKNPDATAAEVSHELRDLTLDEGELQTLEAIRAGFARRRIARNSVLSYVEVITSRQLKRTKRYNDLDADAVRDLEAKLFFSLLTHGKARSDVSFVEFPFAVGFQFSSYLDVETVERGKADDIIASYIDDQCLTNELDAFPLILLGPNANDVSVTHETTHGSNASIFEGLSLEGVVEELWGGNLQNKETVSQLLTGKDHNNQNVLWAARVLMPRIFANVKDEIIAFFNAENTFTSAITLLWQNRINRNLKKEEETIYDYFRFSLGLQPEDFEVGSEYTLYNQLIDEFNDMLISNTGFLRLLWGVSRYEGKNRILKDELISFMRFTPLLLWRKMARFAFPDFTELLAVKPKMEARMEAWLDRIDGLEQEYRGLSEFRGGITYTVFRDGSRQGTQDEGGGADFKKISREGEAICQLVDTLIPQIEETLGAMKDLSLRHDLFDEGSLLAMESKLQDMFFELSDFMRQLGGHYKATVWRGVFNDNT